MLLGWSLTGRQDLWQWYEKVHEYTFRHFPDPEYGEWYGYLDRDGQPGVDRQGHRLEVFFSLAARVVPLLPVAGTIGGGVMETQPRKM